MSFFKNVEVESETKTTRWINDDIRPIEAGRRTWTYWTFSNYWVLINSNISTYLTGSSLIALGLTWWEAIISIVIGNILATLFVVLNSVPGAYYHIGFPVVNRYVWGMYGSAFVIWNRILLSLVWYAFQAWIGGECLYICLLALSPSLETHIPNSMPASTGMTTAQFVAYLLFSLISLPVIYIRPHKLKSLFHYSSATILIFEIVLLIWSLSTMGPAGFGSTLSSSPDVAVSNRGWLIAYGIISTIGSIAAGILNQNDYARFARRPKDAIMGQVFAFPVFGIMCAIIGILVTAATQNRFGEALWNLPDIFTTLILTGGFRERAASFFAGAALVVSQIGVNVPGNALSGGFDLAATFPRYINIRRGAYITAALSMACNPWRLVNTATVFISVLGSYSVFLGPMTGLMISSYFVVMRRKIKVDDMFVGSKNSVYWYSWGVDFRAVVAWICGVVPSMPGFVASVQPSLSVPIGFTHLYYICFLSGFTISAAVYCTLHYVFPSKAVQEWVKGSLSSAVLIGEYRDQWDGEVVIGQMAENSDTDVGKTVKVADEGLRGY